MVTHFRTYHEINICKYTITLNTKLCLCIYIGLYICCQSCYMGAKQGLSCSHFAAAGLGAFDLWCPVPSQDHQRLRLSYFRRSYASYL